MAAVSFPVPSLTIDTIRKGKLDDPKREIDRLAFLMGRATIPEWVLSGARRVGYLPPEVRMMALQGMAIQRVFAETHDTFFHGQSFSAWGPYILTANEAQKKRYLKSSCHKIVRKPTPANPTTFARYKSGETLLEVNTGTIFDDHEPGVRKDLISTTAMLDGTTGSEGPLGYLVTDCNVNQDPDVVTDACVEIIQYSFPYLPLPLISKLVEKIEFLFVSIMKPIWDQYGQFGHLFVFCIPKEQRDKEIHYRAHPFGRACKCDLELSEEEILDKFQRNEVVILSGCEKPHYPQYRLYAHNLTPENGVLIFQCSPYPRSVLEKLKANVQKVLEVVDKFLCRNIEPLLVDHTPLAAALSGLRRQTTYRSNHALITSSAFRILSFL